MRALRRVHRHERESNSEVRMPDRAETRAPKKAEVERELLVLPSRRENVLVLSRPCLHIVSNVNAGSIIVLNVGTSNQMESKVHRAILIRVITGRLHRFMSSIPRKSCSCAHPGEALFSCGNARRCCLVQVVVSRRLAFDITNISSSLQVSTVLPAERSQ
jgi:hypothetical protein